MRVRVRDTLLVETNLARLGFPPIIEVEEKMKWGRYASHELPGCAEACPVIFVTCMSFSFPVPSVGD